MSVYDANIVIIGAGAAGIACATRLIERGFTNVVILEAESRIGGRILTIPFADNVVDLGAQWCHGEEGNVVFDMVKDKNLLDTSGDVFVTYQCIRSNGQILDAVLVKRLKQILADILANRHEDIAKFKGSLGDYLLEKFYAALKLPENRSIDIDIANEFFDNFKRLEASESSIDVDEVSAAGFSDYWECEGDYLLNWKTKGYETFLKLLMKTDQTHKEFGSLHGKIITGATVNRIIWEPDEEPIGVYIEETQEPFHADHVVVTVSLGVLKARLKTLFTPELPTSKIHAIETVGFGNVAKVYLEFFEPFWPKDWTGFNTLWRDEDLHSIRKPKLSWLEDVFGFYSVNYQPRVLVGWVVGLGAMKIETMEKSAVLTGCLGLLRRFLAFMQVPKPMNFKISRWHSNRNFFGSYSFRTIKTSEAKTGASELAQPITCLTPAPRKGAEPVIDRLVIKPILLFAGEATSTHYYSTVHGAVETGWREADRLIGFYDFN